MLVSVSCVYMRTVSYETEPPEWVRTAAVLVGSLGWYEGKAWAVIVESSED